MDWHATWELDRRHIDKGQEAVHACLGILYQRIVPYCVIVLVMVSQAQTQHFMGFILARTDCNPDQGKNQGKERTAVDRLGKQSWSGNMRAELMSLTLMSPVNKYLFKYVGRSKQPATGMQVAGPQ
jgi:hypothetical protein